MRTTKHRFRQDGKDWGKEWDGWAFERLKVLALSDAEERQQRYITALEILLTAQRDLIAQDKGEPAAVAWEQAARTEIERRASALIHRRSQKVMKKQKFIQESAQRWVDAMAEPSIQLLMAAGEQGRDATLRSIAGTIDDQAQRLKVCGFTDDEATLWKEVATEAMQARLAAFHELGKATTASTN